MPDIGTRLLAVCDGLQIRLETGWQPAEPDEVIRDYWFETDLKTLTGRKVYVFPAGAKLVQHASRGAYLKEFRVSIRIVEKYERRHLPSIAHQPR